ncbi:MAG: hypothetical protein ABSC55_26045 [Syntrophorhabdales bacterium]|jgi:hypothetical protein
MATYIILSKFAPGIFEDANKFKERASTVSTKIRSERPAVK